MPQPIEVVVLPKFQRDTKKLLDKNQQELLVKELALFPERGDMIPGSGGIRKLRWGYGAQGKRGGIRVIYYYIKDSVLYLLTAYPKNQKENLSAEELKAIRMLVEILKDHRR